MPKRERQYLEQDKKRIHIDQRREIKPKSAFQYPQPSFKCDTGKIFCIKAKEYEAADKI
jgi:hypothetical protein